VVNGVSFILNLRMEVNEMKRNHLCFWIILVTGAVFLMGQAPGCPAVPKDTGQSKCYNNSGEMSCPSPGASFYGQDAQYATGCQPSYIDNGNGTVTDNCTGLMWQKDDDDQLKIWVDALSYCENLTLGGHADWRLPDVRQLQSLVNYGMHDPAIDSTYFPGTNTDDSYWSSTTVLTSLDLAWSLDFQDGKVEDDSDVWKPGGNYVRCVR